MDHIHGIKKGSKNGKYYWKKKLNKSTAQKNKFFFFGAE